MLSAASLACAAAISSGDYALFFELDGYLKSCMERADTEEERALPSLPGTLAAVGMAAPGMTADYLKNGDFSAFSPKDAPLFAPPLNAPPAKHP